MDSDNVPPTLPLPLPDDFPPAGAGPLEAAPPSGELQPPPPRWPVRPWLSIWFHPRQTIQQIVDVKPLRRIYVLVLLSGIASGIGGWLNAVMMDSDNFQENAVLAVAYGLLVGAAGALMSCVVLQWIAGWRGDSIPYSHLVAASFWGTVPDIGWLLLFIVVFVVTVLASMFLPSTGATGVWIDGLLMLAWGVFGIWSAVLIIGALSQVMRCSIGATIVRQIGAGLVVAAPTWALYKLFSYVGDSFSGDIVVYQSSGGAAEPSLMSIAGPAAALVLSMAVLFAMYRSSRAKSLAASLYSKKEEV
jgi:hypothetical protein